MIRLDGVTKTFGTGASALEDLSLSIDDGEFVFLIGPSGSGKTTFLRLLIREMLPTSGSIYLSDWDIGKLPASKVPNLRKKIGVVFQDLKLLNDRTILENVLLPLEMVNMGHEEAVKKVEDILEQVGILEHRDKFPIQLSGGELQRAAIARALVFEPEVILADEPTGNLDMTTSWEIVKLLQEINKNGTTIIMATHNNDIVSSLLKRVIGLEKGKLVKDNKKKPEKKELPEEEAPAKKSKDKPKEDEKTKDIKETDEVA